jgi:metallo-beta-lactamase class B
MMSKEDWDATLPAQRPERPLAKRDMDITHGQKLTLGDTTLTFTTLFGHSAGSLGIFIPVKWRGQPSVVWLHGGGLHHPTRASFNRLEEVVNAYARPMGAQALLNTHPGLYQDTIADMAAIRKNPNGANPILLGSDRASRYWSMMLDCARARLIALEEAAKTRS